MGAGGELVSQRHPPLRGRHDVREKSLHSVQETGETLQRDDSVFSLPPPTEWADADAGRSTAPDGQSVGSGNGSDFVRRSVQQRDRVADQEVEEGRGGADDADQQQRGRQRGW